jgi:hypothetical protein
MVCSQPVVLSAFLLFVTLSPCHLVTWSSSEVDTTAADEETLKAAGVGVDGPALLEFFRKGTLTDDRWNQIKALIRKLGDRSYRVREKASAELLAEGSAAVPLLRLALKDPDIEVVRRAEDCLRQIAAQAADPSLAAAAARLLALRKPAGAAEVLLAYLPFTDGEDLVVEEIHTTLGALALRDGKADPVLGAALTDPVPARRLAAAVALCRAGVAEQQPAVRNLLQDTDLAVRLRVAMALAFAKERDAIPVLIELLALLPQAQAWPAEDLLHRLAGEQAPDATLGRDDASRRTCRDAWAAWWREHAASADLSRLEGGHRLLGYTLIVMLDLGRVLELDADDQPRWQIDNLEKPLDAQVLPGDRVLIAEHDGNRVTERNRKGEVLWRKDVEGPLVAQRLPNGHTFIANQLQLLEVDRHGKEVFSFARPGGELIMRAQKLRNGDIACITSAGPGEAYRFVRLAPTGREALSFPVHVKTSGGRIDVLPNGHVLVPEYAHNRVVEYTPTGKAVWEAAIDAPIAAVRLPNGNTLVTSMNQQRAVEFDRTGKLQVWEYAADTKVTRAYRR